MFSQIQSLKESKIKIDIDTFEDWLSPIDIENLDPRRIWEAWYTLRMKIKEKIDFRLWS